MAELHNNLEIKARYSGLEAGSVVMQRMEVERTEKQVQVDTYFHVASGRLKLRETEMQGAWLIWYERPNQQDSRRSQYYLVPTSEPELLKQALRAGLGIRGEVRKQRDIFLWHNVRIHLDEVDGLGTFVEFEAVLRAEEPQAISQGRLDKLCQEFKIGPESKIGVSYADLLGI